jgi:hypothetical protein
LIGLARQPALACRAPARSIRSRSAAGARSRARDHRALALVQRRQLGRRSDSRLHLLAARRLERSVRERGDVTGVDFGFHRRLR